MIPEIPAISQQFQSDVSARTSPQRAKVSARFFKTGPGQYGEGDQFIGITVPDVRKLATRYRSITLAESETLLLSAIHEMRLLALCILADQFKQGNEDLQSAIFQLYLSNTDRINNWDLVDTSAEHIVGAWLEHRDRSILWDLAHSRNLWERRIAILSTFRYIKAGDPVETLRMAEILLSDRHALIHKAVGWMLREVGKRCSLDAEMAFLDQHYKTMPRIMLRYAIERFSAEKRAHYMAK